MKIGLIGLGKMGINIGKIPNIVVVTIAGANFTSNKLLSISIYGTYILIIMLVIYKKFPHLLKVPKK